MDQFRAAYLVAREDDLSRAGILLAPPSPDDSHAPARTLARAALKVADGDPCPIYCEIVPEFNDIPLGDKCVSLHFLANDASGNAAMVGSDFAALPKDRIDAVAKRAQELHDRVAGKDSTPNADGAR